MTAARGVAPDSGAQRTDTEPLADNDQETPWAYVRRSTGKQAESPASQRARIEHYCAAHGYDLAQRHRGPAHVGLHTAAGPTQRRQDRRAAPRRAACRRMLHQSWL